MKKYAPLYAALAVLFLAAAVLASRAGAVGAPYSSYSNEREGTRAAYLLLEEMGFQVKRKTAPEWDGDGALLALGRDYLPDNPGALTLEEEYRFTNLMIRENAYAFVAALWPYRGAVIYFEEYGRAIRPYGEGDTLTLGVILPLWAKVLLGDAAAGFFLAMCFYRQYLGEALPAPDFALRTPLEGVQAMARALAASRLYGDCVRYYYQYQTRGGAQWDTDQTLERRLPRIADEREALAVIRAIDRKKKEYQ